MTTPGGVVPFVGALARHGHRPALLSGDHVLSYERLSGLVADTADQLGPVRRLVLLEAANTVESVTTYLAALHGGHVVLLVPAGQLGPCSELIDTYDPDVVAGRRPGGWTVEDRHVGSQHELHPDLALLLSTSGSTGSPKLARLSARNIQSNAEAIVRSLRIRPADRAITTLPMSYCYGLSVLNSHLLAGASLVLSVRSVVDE